MKATEVLKLCGKPGEKVSVVIPLYNKRPYILRAINSVLKQTVLPKEIIVVNDGSSDGGGEIVERLRHPLVRVLHQTNKGVSAARNRGVVAASSKWVAFLDADDEWFPEFVEQSAMAIDKWTNVAAVFTNYSRGKNGPAVLPSGQGSRVLDNYFRFVLRNRGRGMTASSVAIHRDILLKIGGFPEGVHRGEDLDTWSRIGWAGQVGYISHVLAVYHVTPGSVTQTHATGRSQPPVDPWGRKIWPPDELIPYRLKLDGRRVFQLRMRAHVRGLLERGETVAARHALRTQCFPVPYLLDYAKIWLQSIMPRAVWQRMRKLKGARWLPVSRGDSG